MTRSRRLLRLLSLAGLPCSLMMLIGGCPFGVWGALLLDEGDSGSSVTVRAGQELRVHLNSNASTGFEWTLADLDTTILEHTDTIYYGCSFPMPGCPDSQTWVFTAVSPGTTELRLTYLQNWEGGMFGRTFELTITVSDS